MKAKIRVVALIVLYKATAAVHRPLAKLEGKLYNVRNALVRRLVCEETLLKDALKWAAKK